MQLWIFMFFIQNAKSIIKVIIIYLYLTILKNKLQKEFYFLSLKFGLQSRISETSIYGGWAFKYVSIAFCFSISSLWLSVQSTSSPFGRDIFWGIGQLRKFPGMSACSVSSTTGVERNSPGMSNSFGNLFFSSHHPRTVSCQANGL